MYTCPNCNSEFKTQTDLQEHFLEETECCDVATEIFEKHKIGTMIDLITPKTIWSEL